MHYFSVYRSSWVTIKGTTYKPLNIVVVGSSLLPVFGRIISILIEQVTKCYFVCEVLTTETFNPHFHAYEVQAQEKPTPLVICTQNDFIDHHVLALYHVSQLELVPLKYHVPENIG